MCRRVVDTKDTYFIVYRRWACSACRVAQGRPETTYGPWTDTVYADMQKEHPDICDDLGVVFTAKNAVTEEVMDYITHHATSGLSFAKQAEYFKGLHHKHAHRRRKKYLRAVKKWRRRHDDDLEAEEWSQFETAPKGKFVGLPRTSGTRKLQYLAHAARYVKLFQGDMERGGAPATPERFNRRP
jgi:hypothetical protein